MKKLFQLFLLTFSIMLLAACGNSSQQAGEVLGLLQENVTQIVNELNEVQILENNLQSDFETILQENEDFEIFNGDDSLVQVNIEARKEHLTNLTNNTSELNELIQELEQVNKKDIIPASQFDQVMSHLTNLSTDLDVYIADYQENLTEESMTFKSIANPETDYQSFFGVFSNIDILSTENYMNLDKLLVHFEPLNIQLINLKISLLDN